MKSRQEPRMVAVSTQGCDARAHSELACPAGSAASARDSPLAPVMSSGSYRRLLAAQPLRVAETRDIETVGGAAIKRRRSQPAERREIIDMQARADELIRDVKHHHLADEQGVGAQRLGLVQRAFKA